MWPEMKAIFGSLSSATDVETCIFPSGLLTVKVSFEYVKRLKIRIQENLVLESLIAPRYTNLAFKIVGNCNRLTAARIVVVGVV